MNTIQSLKAQIAAAQAGMSKDKAVADQLAEMQAAARRVAEGTRAVEQLNARLAEADEASRMHSAALSKYSILSVDCKDASPTPASVHTVRFSERSIGLEGEHATTRAVRLDSIPHDLMLALGAVPDKIPARILALAGDTYAALRAHAFHAGRGYWSAPADYANGARPAMDAPGRFLAPGVAQL